MCPPGVDQTMRSSQSWRVIAPELLQTHGIDDPDPQGSWFFDLGRRIFNPDVHWDAWGKLARPALPLSATNSQSHSSRARKLCTKLSMFEQLSNELLDMILDHLAPEKTDIIALGLSSQYLWEIALRYIHAGYLKSAYPWAEKMIAFQGSYSRDLPEAFQKDGMVESIVGKSWFGNMCAARRFFWAHSSEDLAATPYSEKAAWLMAARSHRAASEIPETCWWTIEDELDCSYLFPERQEWLLRNLTTKEMISSRQFRGPKVRETQNKNDSSVSFDDVILMQTCWTDIPSTCDEDLGITRGAWAGHRFDIVTLETHQAQETPGAWTDVSGAILKRVVEVRKRFSEQRDTVYAVENGGMDLDQF